MKWPLTSVAKPGRNVRTDHLPSSSELTLVQIQVIPPLHRRDIAEPHVRDLMALRRRDVLLAVQVRLLGVEEERARAPGDEAPVLHRARVEVGRDERVELGVLLTIMALLPLHGCTRTLWNLRKKSEFDHELATSPRHGPRVLPSSLAFCEHQSPRSLAPSTPLVRTTHILDRTQTEHPLCGSIRAQSSVDKCSKAVVPSPLQQVTDVTSQRKNTAELSLAELR